MAANKATYRDLLKFFKELEAKGDNRLDDNVTVYNSIDGEYYPADIVEFNGDDILDNGHLFLMATDWNETFTDEENDNG